MTQRTKLFLFGTPSLVFLIALIAVLIFGTKGCFGSSNDLFSEAAENLTAADQKAAEGKASHDAYNRQRDAFIIKNGGTLQEDEDLPENKNRTDTREDCDNCPPAAPALSDDEILLKAKEIAAKKGEVENITDKLNGKNTSTSNANTSSGTHRSSARASRSYRPAPAPAPKPVINNYNYYGSKESSSYRAESTSVQSKKESTTAKETINESTKEVCTTCDNENTPGTVNVKTSDGIRSLKTQAEKDEWFGNYRNSGGKGHGEKHSLGSYRKEVPWKCGIRIITSESEYRQYQADIQSGKGKCDN